MIGRYRARLRLRLFSRWAPVRSAEQVVLQPAHERGHARAVLGRDVPVQAADAHGGLARVLRPDQVGCGRGLVGDGDDRSRAARGPGVGPAAPVLQRRAGPATPIATSHWPVRHARPNESVMTTAGRPGSAARSARADASGSSGEQDQRSGGRGVGRIDARVRAHEPVAGAADEPAARPPGRAARPRRARPRCGAGPCHGRPRAGARARRARRRRGRTSRPSALETTLCATTSTSVGGELDARVAG